MRRKPYKEFKHYSIKQEIRDFPAMMEFGVSGCKATSCCNTRSRRYKLSQCSHLSGGENPGKCAEHRTILKNGASRPSPPDLKSTSSRKDLQKTPPSMAWPEDVLSYRLFPNNHVHRIKYFSQSQRPTARSRPTCAATGLLASTKNYPQSHHH